VTCAAAAFVVFASVAGFAATANIASGPTRTIKWTAYPTILLFLAAAAQARGGLGISCPLDSAGCSFSCNCCQAISYAPLSCLLLQTVAWTVYVGFIQKSYDRNAFNSGQAILGGALVDSFSPCEYDAMALYQRRRRQTQCVPSSFTHTCTSSNVFDCLAAGFALSVVSMAVFFAAGIFASLRRISSTEPVQASLWPMPGSSVVLALGWIAWCVALLVMCLYSACFL
jgi:hypothetical protein